MLTETVDEIGSVEVTGIVEGELETVTSAVVDSSVVVSSPATIFLIISMISLFGDCCCSRKLPS